MRFRGEGALVRVSMGYLRVIRTSRTLNAVAKDRNLDHQDPAMMAEMEDS